MRRTLKTAFSASQVLKKRQHPPLKQYYFLISQKETKLGKFPPSPYKVYSSLKHWHKECPYCDEYLERLKAKNAQLAALQVNPNASPEDVYHATYQILALEVTKNNLEEDDGLSNDQSGFYPMSQTSEISKEAFVTESKFDETTQEIQK